MSGTDDAAGSGAPGRPAGPEHPDRPFDPRMFAGRPWLDDWLRHEPFWRHDSEGESALATSLSVAVIGVLHIFLPAQLAALRAPQVTGAIIVVCAVALFFAHPRRRITERNQVLQHVSQALLLAIIVVNAISLVLLVKAIFSPQALTPQNLLIGGAIVWLTNVAAFGFLFWEYDRGGPVARANAHTYAEKRRAGDTTVKVADTPDLLFPQMQDPQMAHAFAPKFIDYLYVAFTNAIAFSPTDTMPLSHWTKVLFTAESIVSFGTISLVAARAINVLPS